jgi:hypothetical protein
MAIPGIQEIQTLATKYSKTQLQQMAQRGLIDPTKAVMAGMMIDRIQQQNMQPPQQTVADEVLGVNVLRDRFGNVVRSGSGQAVRTGVEQDRFGNVIRPTEKQSAGVTALPSGLPEEMAGGGLVAFAEGGDVPGYAKGDLIGAADTVRRSGMTPDQLAQMFASAGPGAPADSGAPAVQPAQSGIQNLAFPKEAGMGGVKLRDYPTRPEPSLKSEFDLLREAQKEAGLDDAAMFRQMREEEKTRREELKGRKDQAFGNALIMAGFGLLGARKGEEFEVLSTVGRQGVMQYGAALKDIRETENDIRKAERQLTLAENQLKRDQSSKAQDRYDTKLKELRDIEIKSVDQYNKTVGDLTKLNMDVWKVNEEKAYRMAIAQLESQTRLDVEKLQQSGAFARAGMGETSTLAKEVLADLRKTNPNATLADAVAIVKGGGGVSAASLADKAADNVSKRAQVDMNFAMSLRDPNAYAKAVEEETRRLQGQAGRPSTTGASAYQLSPEAQKALQQYGGK